MKNRALIVAWSLALFGCLSVFGFAQLLPLTGNSGAGFTRFLGRFHPLILHFPVACLAIAGLLQLTRFFEKFKNLASFTGPVLIFAAASAVVTVILGIMLGANEGHSGELVSRHRSRGINVALLSCLSAALYYTAEILKNKKIEYGAIGSLVAAIMMMGAAAHDGGSLVHGPTYLADHAPPMIAPMLITHTSADNPHTPSIQDKLDANHTSPISRSLLDKFDNDVGSFMGSYCSRCHGPGKQEANVRLDEFDPEFKSHSSAHHWQRVLGVLGSHRMPPAEAKQPSDDSRATAISWIHSALEEHAYARRKERANAPLRRLTKRELNNTLEDLFNIKTNYVSRLPADPKSEKGYDTDANLLMVSMSDLKHYHGIARQAVESYVEFGPRAQKVDNYFVELEDVYHFGRLEGDELSYERAGTPLTDAQIAQIKQVREQSKPVYRNRKYGPLPYGLIPNGDVRGVGEGRGFARLHEQFMLLKTTHAKGEVTIRVHAAMTPGKDGDESLPRLRLEAGWRKIQSLRADIVGEADISASLENPQIVEFKFRLEDVLPPETARWDDSGEDRWVLLVLSNVARHEHGALAGSIYGQIDVTLESSKTAALPYVQQEKSARESTIRGMKAWEEGGVPYLYLDAVEASITPVSSDERLAWRIPTPPEEASLEEEKSIVSEALEQFLPEAFRRPVSKDEINKYIQLFTGLRSNGDDYKTSVRETLASVLISPSFLYIGYPEPKIGLSPKEAESKRLNNYLASRLSYFIWSSKPDKELRNLASNYQLTDPSILSTQIDRMFADPKSKRFSKSFAEQWLQLSKLANTSINLETYPEYGPHLSKLTHQETVLKIQDNIHANRDARELYKSDYMMLNDQLAHHYGVKDVIGGDIRRVKVGPNPNRAGILTQASVMAINSDGTDSHPIKRGVWMLERLLNDPPPPPPPSVPELDPNNPVLAGLSLKQKIEHHRKLSACSGCHEQIDPWGVTLENFDATGRWRTSTTTSEETAPINVDASSTLPDGTHVASLPELSEYLFANKEKDLMLSLTHHLMIYSLGRELDVLDEQEAEVIFSAFRASGYRIQDLTKAIIQSDAFTNRPSAQTNSKREHS